MRLRFLGFLLMTLAFASCANKQQGLAPEQQAAQMLSEARQLLADGEYEAARDTILSLRKKCPTALDARRQAILTLDSIEWKQAEQEGDELKTEFFLRKIEHDRAACASAH